MKPKWQRARIVSACKYKGLEFWVRVGPPAAIWSTRNPKNAGGAIFNRPIVCFETNIETDDYAGDPRCENGLCVVEESDVELLARDDKDFAEDVDLVSWEEWFNAPSQARRSG